MKLTDLQPQFLRRETDSLFHHVDTLDDADGISFLCPVCFNKNNGPVGTHQSICWFRGKVPDSTHPSPGRWTPSGTGYNDLTFVPGVPALATSVLDPGHAHYLIEKGEVRIL